MNDPRLIDRVRPQNAIVVALQTTEAWGARHFAPAESRASVELFAALLDAMMKLDGYSDGEVSRAGRWNACLFLAPVFPEHLRSAKAVAENIIKTGVVAEKAWVVVLTPEGVQMPENWTVTDLAQYAKVATAAMGPNKTAEGDCAEADRDDADWWKKGNE